MNPGVLWSIALSFVLGLLTVPLAHRYLPSVASPYPKAETRRRLLAGLADGSICLLTALQAERSENLQLLLLGVLYASLRDGIRGRSLGKLLCGLTVIRLDGGTPIGPTRSLVRNVVFLVPGLNLPRSVGRHCFWLGILRDSVSATASPTPRSSRAPP